SPGARGATSPSPPRSRGRGRAVALHCSDCGFVNVDGANYCQRCGHFLGGGRVGESFPLDGDRMTIGRRPDSDIFLDDVTVSRDHSLLVRRGGDLYLDDLGSLNGTYVNRHRIESHRLEDGDELQVGKFKLTFLSQ